MADLEEGDEQVLLARLAQNLAENFDGLATSEQEAHGHPCYTRHLDVVVHVHQLVHQALGQVCILQCQTSPSWYLMDAWGYTLPDCACLFAEAAVQADRLSYVFSATASMTLCIVCEMI